MVYPLGYYLYHFVEDKICSFTCAISYKGVKVLCVCVCVCNVGYQAFCLQPSYIFSI
jgi:hypothetical protein